MSPPSEMHQERLPVIQLPMQPSATVRHRHTLSSSSTQSFSTDDIADPSDQRPPAVVGGADITNRTTLYVNPLTWFSRIYARAKRQEHLHYHHHTHGGHHHHHHHLPLAAHSNSCKHLHHQQQQLYLPSTYQQPQHRYPTRSKARARQLAENALSGADTAISCTCCAPSKHLSLKEQLFAKATVVTLEPKYSTVGWAAEFYCTVTSPFFALPLSLYLDPGFRWSAPDAHLMHFTIWLSVLTAIVSSTYHATLYKLFSSLDACLATIMFYLNTIHLMRSMPEPYQKMTKDAMVVPDPLADWLGWDSMPYVLVVVLATLFLLSWQKTAKLSMLLMIPMIPASIWGFVAHESWLGLVCGVTGLGMFAADRFHYFCGHSWWHLAGGISLYCGIRAAAVAVSSSL
ncbi:hypothetical protein BGW41_001827 [Actinomortierella wolfii]|nr:hypothetical protein BGW41_001827 [Actinomortierella wolfii]